MSNLIDHARNELELAGFFDSDSDYGGELGKAVMELIQVFSDQGHSGFSAAMTLKIFSAVADFQTLSPLTGEDDEWIEVYDGTWQNKRHPSVFKDSSGAYNSEGRIFRTPSGLCYSNSNSRVPVEFPYTPSKEYVDVEE